MITLRIASHAILSVAIQSATVFLACCHGQARIGRRQSATRTTRAGRFGREWPASLSFRTNRAFVTGLMFVMGLAFSTRAQRARGQDLPDWSGELPRIAPSAPAEALRKFHVMDGFRIELVAAEPMVVDPVAIAFDADGRLYAVEMRNYSEDAELPLGRIRRLTDTDGDGRFDESVVFADGFSWPTAITCYDGGVLIAVAPDLIFLKDTDGDGRADISETRFRGFGRSNVQGLVNTLQWGLDNRIHGATSSSGALIEQTQHPAAAPIELRGRDFAIDPNCWQLVPVSGGGQHGMSFNRWGEKFVCSNSDHIQQIVYEDRYLSGHPDVSPLPARISIAADGPQADVFRTSPIEPWRIVRTRLRVAGQVPGPVEGGGRPAGYFTGATGVTIYRGNAWAPDYLDYAFVCDVGSNLIHRKRLIDQGITYRAERVDAGTEFVTSEDIWFRPVQLANAPDGALYVVDMCREVIEHPASLPPEIKRHLDLTSGRDRGRIYRIVPTDFSQPALPRLSHASADELVTVLAHPNGWHRETAARLLFERQDATVTPRLRELLQRGETPEARLQAIHALAGLSQLSSDDLRMGWADSHPRLREHAVRLSEPQLAVEPALRTALRQLAVDPDPRVRYQLALTLGTLPATESTATELAQLARAATDQPYLQFAVELSTGEQLASVLSHLARDPAATRSTAGTAYLQRLARQLSRRADAATRTTIAEWVVDWDANSPELLEQLAPAWLLPTDSPLARELTTGAAAPAVSRLLARWKSRAFDTSLPEEVRVASIRGLAADPSPDTAARIDDLLAAAQALPIQFAALETIAAAQDDPRLLRIQEAWSSHSPSLRSRIVDVLLSRRSWIDQLTASLAAQRISFADLSAGQQQQLSRALGAEAWRQLQSRLHTAPAPDVEQLLTSYRERIAASPDVDRGRTVFRKACATCHRLEDHGYEVGPNLAAMQNRGAETILLNVLDPNREINPQFLAYTAETQDGRILTGIIRNETGTSIELVAADNQSTTLLRADLESITSTGQSLMPTGLNQQISPDDMSSLIHYLLSLRP